MWVNPLLSRIDRWNKIEELFSSPRRPCLCCLCPASLQWKWILFPFILYSAWIFKKTLDLLLTDVILLKQRCFCSVFGVCVCVCFSWALVYISFLVVSWQECMVSDFWLNNPVEECGNDLLHVSETWHSACTNNQKHVLEGNTYTRPSGHPRHRPHNCFLLFLIGLAYVRR